MKIDFVKAILANTEKCLGKPSITGDIRLMLEAQRIRLLDKLSLEDSLLKTKIVPKVKVKSRIKTKKKK